MLIAHNITRAKNTRLFDDAQIEKAGIETVEKEVLKKVKTYISETETIPNDIVYFRKIILPPFQKLFKKCPQLYKFLMKSDFEVAVINYQCSNFTASYYDRASKDMYFNETNARTASAVPDRSVIYVNKRKHFKEKVPRYVMRDDVYHEIMHAASYLSVADNPDRDEINKLSDYLNKKHNNILTRLSRKYILRQEKAVSKCRLWLKNHKCEKDNKSVKQFYKNFYKFYHNKINEHKCWAAKRLPKGVPGSKVFFSYCLPDISRRPVEEMLVEGLTHYFGTEEEKKWLRSQEPELYYLIEIEFLLLMEYFPIKYESASQKLKKLKAYNFSRN